MDLQDANGAEVGELGDDILAFSAQRPLPTLIVGSCEPIHIFLTLQASALSHETVEMKLQTRET